MKPCEGAGRQQHTVAGDERRLHDDPQSKGEQGQAEDPWRECMDTAVQLALQAGQVRAYPVLRSY